MKYLILLVAVFSASCKVQKNGVDDIYAIPTYKEYNYFKPMNHSDMVQDSEIQPFVDEHEQHKYDFHVAGSDSTLYYKFDATLSSNVLGRCVEYLDGNLITINPTFWASASEWDKRSVVFHELGHCDLGRGHRTYTWQGTRGRYDTNMLPNWGNNSSHSNWPISIMNSTIVREAKFSAETEYYIYELYHVGLYEGEGVGNLEIDCDATVGLDGHIHFGE